ncbi:MAG: hypothetical protein OEU46_13195 [Alphaproteobacteria bacterium]|nr:hypothetical protein [Alphaproteobacteria bacterium]
MTIALAFGVGAILSQTAPVSAQSACKGLAKGKCTSNSSCSWVGGYQTKAGKAVKSYCRSTSKGAAKKSGAAKVKKAKVKSTAKKKSAKADAAKKLKKAKTATKAAKEKVKSKVLSADKKIKK